MRPLKNNKNLPNIAHPLIFPPQHKNRSQKYHQYLSISHSQFLIINSSSLPLKLELQTMNNLVFDILITYDTVQLRSQSLRQNLPQQFEPKQWVKLDFGEKMKTISIKSMQKENKLINTPIYSSEISWNTAEHGPQDNLKDISLHRPIVYLTNMIKRQILDDSISLNMPKHRLQNTINIMKNRTNSTGIRSKLLTLRERSINISQRNANSKKLISNFYKKKESKQASFNKQRNLSSSNKKRSLTSNNSSRPPTSQQKQQSRFNKTKVLKLQHFCDQIEIFEPNNKRFLRKPKFYQKIPFTFEQIELKRKKFDSQFFPSESKTVNIDLTNGAIKTDQSQIVEDIFIREQSHFSNFQDTFQKGMQKCIRPMENFQQSGTLCESVFQ